MKTSRERTVRHAGLAVLTGAIALTGIAGLFRSSSAPDDCSNTVKNHSLPLGLTHQWDKHTLCNWYQQLPEQARDNLRADADYFGMSLGEYLGDYLRLDQSRGPD